MQDIRAFQQLSVATPPVNDAELRLANFAAQRGAGDHRQASMLALQGARSADGRPLPFLPRPVTDIIGSKLDADTAVSLAKVWASRLSGPRKLELLARAAKHYGLSSPPQGTGWQLHIERLAEGLRKPNPYSFHARAYANISRVDAVLAGVLLGHIPPYEAVQRFHNHRGLLDYAIEQDGLALLYALPKFRADHHVAVRAVRKDGRALQCLSAELTNNIELVRLAVRQRGLNVEYASKQLQADRSIALCAVDQDGMALEYLQTFQGDREVVFRALTCNGLALQYVERSLQQHPDTVMHAVRQAGAALQYVGRKFWEVPHCREVVMCAVQQNGLALAHAFKFWRDLDIVKCAVQQNPQALRHADWKFRGDREFVLDTVRRDGLVLEHVGSQLQCDEKVVMCAVQQNGLALQFANTLWLRFQHNVALSAVRQNPEAIEYVPWDLRSEPDVVEAAAKKCP